MGVGEDARHRVAEELVRTARPLCGHEAAHDDAPELRLVGHRGAMRVAVDGDGVVHRSVMEDRLRLAVVVLEEPDAEVDKAVGGLRGVLVGHGVVGLAREASTWRQGVPPCDDDVVDEPAAEDVGGLGGVHPRRLHGVPVEVGELRRTLEAHRYAAALP